MKIGLFFPYGVSQSEANVGQLIGAAAIHYGVDVVSASCNGILSLCDKDKQTNWKREATTCFHCQCGQDYVQKWGGFPRVELSRYLSAEFFSKSRRWLQEVTKSELLQVSIGDLPFSSVCTQTFRLRFEKSFSEKSNLQEERFYRMIVLNTLRVYEAIQCFVRQEGVDTLLVSGQEQFVSNAARLACVKAGKESVGITSDKDSSQALLRHSNKAEPLLASVAVSQLELMRRDVTTWPKEFFNNFSPALRYIGIEDEQLDLPIRDFG